MCNRYVEGIGRSFCFNFDANIAETSDKGGNACKGTETAGHVGFVSSAHTSFSPCEGRRGKKAGSNPSTNHAQCGELNRSLTLSLASEQKHWKRGNACGRSDFCWFVRVFAFLYTTSNFNNGIAAVEYCMLRIIEKYGNVPFSLCNDFNARTAKKQPYHVHDIEYLTTAAQEEHYNLY